MDRRRLVIIILAFGIVGAVLVYSARMNDRSSDSGYGAGDFYP